MNATTTYIPCVSLDVESTPSHGFVTHSVPVSSACRRCGGLLVGEHCMDNGGGYRLWAMRCIQCGDIIDETILVNRYVTRAPLQQVGRAA